MGDFEGTDNPATIIMDTSKTINARFVYSGFGNTQNAINFGGPGYVAVDGTIFTGNTEGSYYSTSANITGTEDQKLYQTERFGNNFSINIPADNGTYRVTLMFAEIYWDEPGTRVFNVSIEGEQVLSNMDIYAEVGKNTANNKTFEVTITDGKINIDFITITDNAKISAIKVESNTFEGEKFALTTGNTTNGKIGLNPIEGPYPAGSNVQITAIPDSGYMFTAWSGDLTGSENPAIIYMNSPKNVSAGFEATNWYTLTTNATNGNISALPEK